jgi:zinc protease
MKFKARLSMLFLSLIVAAVAFDPVPAQPTSQISPAARAAWGFDRSNLAPHPGVRFGVLSNGLRYAIMKNAAPAGGLSVRLRLDAGANVEGEGERGFIHLIEHLIFHGTANIPEGSLPLMLAHRGMRHWSDFNAFTSYDETVYRLDMTRSGTAARDAALLVMREVAGNLLFTRPVVRNAKRKVREEIGARDAAEDGIQAAQNAFFAPGTAIARGPVGGTRSQVGRATGAALRRLYETHYVPQRTTLVFVGDFDPETVEAEIAARFSDWRASGAPAADPPPPLIRAARGREAHLFVHRAAPTAVTIASTAPLGTGVDAGGRRDTHFLEHLGSLMLNRRLVRVAAGSDAPFLSGDVAIYDHFSTVRLARIELEARDRDWRRALEAGAIELRRAVKRGFSQDELDEQLAVTRRNLIRNTAPPASSALADSIVDHVNRRIVFTAPGDPSGTDAYLARIRLAEVNAAFGAAWGQAEPLIFVSHHRRIRNAEAAIAAAWREAWAIPPDTADKQGGF